MAVAAYRRGAQLSAMGTDIVGVACTCALATDREKRGEHKAYIATYTGTQERRRVLNCRPPLPSTHTHSSCSCRTFLVAPLPALRGASRRMVTAGRCCGGSRHGCTPTGCPPCCIFAPLLPSDFWCIPPTPPPSTHTTPGLPPALPPPPLPAASRCCCPRGRAPALPRTRWSASWSSRRWQSPWASRQRRAGRGRRRGRVRGASGSTCGTGLLDAVSLQRCRRLRATP